MITLDGYETTEAKEFHPFENPPSGGYVLEVVSVSDKPATSGKAMVTLGLDIAEGEHKGAFTKYPKPYRQLVHDDNGQTSPYFKAMMKYFGESNPPQRMAEVIFKQRDGSTGFNPQKLVGLRIGGNLREAEYIKQETKETKVGLEIPFLGAVKDVPLMKALPLKRLQAAAPAARTQAPSAATMSGRAPLAQDDTVPF